MFNVIICNVELVVSLPHWEGDMCTPMMYSEFCIVHTTIYTIMALIVH